MSELEKILTEAMASDTKDVSIFLPRDRSPGFFKETQLAAFIATIGKCRNLTTVDWHNQWISEEADEHFCRSLVGINALFHSRSVQNMKGQQFPMSCDSVLGNVMCEDGILEAPDRRGRATTICAFDSEWGEPPTMANAFNNRERFIDRFRELRKGLEFSKLRQPDQDQRHYDAHFCELVYELYQNTREHGRFGPWIESDGRRERLEIPGVRFIALRRHFGKHDTFKRYADGFSELTDYLSTLEFEKQGKELNLWEVSIGDIGMGIMERYLDDHRGECSVPQGSEEEIKLINQILTQSLSSKQFSGVGKGLRHALKALRLLDGFVSLRTGKQWLCGSKAWGIPMDNEGLRAVSSGKNLSRVEGTWYNFLFPMPSQK